MLESGTRSTPCHLHHPKLATNQHLLQAGSCPARPLMQTICPHLIALPTARERGSRTAPPREPNLRSPTFPTTSLSPRQESRSRVHHGQARKQVCEPICQPKTSEARTQPRAGRPQSWRAHPRRACLARSRPRRNSPVAGLQVAANLGPERGSRVSQPQPRPRPKRHSTARPAMTSKGPVTGHPIEPSGPVEDLIDGMKDAARQIKDAVIDVVSRDPDYPQPPQERRSRPQRTKT